MTTKNEPPENLHKAVTKVSEEVNRLRDCVEYNMKAGVVYQLDKTSSALGSLVSAVQAQTQRTDTLQKALESIVVEISGLRLALTGLSALSAIVAIGLFLNVWITPN